MPAGIIFRIGGALDPTYKTALAQSVAEAKAANLQINAQAQASAAMTRTDLGLQEKAFLVSRARSLSEQSAIRKQINDLKLVQAAMIAKSPKASAEKVAVADAIAKKEAEIEILQANRAALELAKIKNDAGLKLTAAETVRLKNSQAEFVAIVKKGQDEEIAGQKLTKLEEVAAAKAADAEQVEANQAKIQAIIAQEKLAGRVYEDEKAAQLAATDIMYAEEVAAAKAADLAILEARVASAAAGKSSGGHGPAGMTGIIRESLVIMREVSMGRGLGRIGGSVTLLAQYLGVLNLAVKSSATESVLAAAAQKKLSIEMDIAALRAKGTAAYTELETAAKAQNVIATDADTVANYELLTAKVALNAVFFVGVGLIVAAGAAAFFCWRHFSRLATEAKNLADALNPLKKKFTELAEAEAKAAKATQQNSDYLDELLNKHQSESDALAEKIKLLHEEADARRKAAKDRGASEAKLQAMDEAALQKEKAMLLVEQARLKAAQDKAVADEKTASAADIKGATLTDAKGNVIDLEQAKDKVKRLGEIADRAQSAADDSDLGKRVAGFVVDNKAGSRAHRSQKDFNQLKSELDSTNFEAGTKENPLSVTVADAQANYNAAKADAQKLETDQAHLDDVLKNKKSSLEEINAAYTKVAGGIDDVNGRIKNKDESPDSKKEHQSRTATERERVGIGAPQVANLQKQTLDVTRRQLSEAQKLNSKIDRLIASGNGDVNNPDRW